MAPFLLALSLGCQATVDGGSGPGGGGNGAAGSAQNIGGGVPLPPGTRAAALLPARIRRLSDAEYQASVSDARVLGADADGVSVDFVPDSRQSGFTLNEAQRVDPVFARQLADAATKLSGQFRRRIGERAPCASPTTDADKCATDFIRTFGNAAYRRPLGDDEVERLLTVFHAAYAGGSYEDGIELLVRAMLQSAAFLYLTEIGEKPAATVKLTPEELASSISYLVQGRPPSELLLQMARAGQLDTPESRLAATTDANLALFRDGAEARVVRVIEEWLGINKVADIAKDSGAYPKFASAKEAVDAETQFFIDNVISGEANGGGSLAELLAGNWGGLNAPLAEAYELTNASLMGNDFVRVETPGRLGILNQGAFLSVFAHANETAPVLRGVAVMRRVACSLVGDPVNLASAVVPPAPDPSKTTRQRFAAHATPGCNACHDRIDSFGFAFEGFDGMGKARPMDNGAPVDASVVIAGTDFDGSYADSNALVKAMSTSAQVRECFATTSADELKPSEDDFVTYWKTTLEADGSGKVTDAKIVGTLTAFLTNPSFAYRRAQ
jgi:hypothetical protein